MAPRKTKPVIIHAENKGVFYGRNDESSPTWCGLRADDVECDPGDWDTVTCPTCLRNIKAAQERLDAEEAAYCKAHEHDRK